MTDFNNYNFGILTNTDVEQIFESLKILKETFKFQKLNILEIGTFDGRTARGVRQKMLEMNMNFNFYSIDDGSHMKHNEKPFEECNMIFGDSTECFNNVPEELHWVFIDGCHCVNHIMLDFLNYGHRVVNGGVLLFHDTAPQAQAVHRSIGSCWQQHGNKEDPEFGIATLKAFEKLDIHNRQDWELVSDRFDPKPKLGGISIFRKVK